MLARTVGKHLEGTGNPAEDHIGSAPSYPVTLDLNVPHLKILEETWVEPGDQAGAGEMLAAKTGEDGFKVPIRWVCVETSPETFNVEVGDSSRLSPTRSAARRLGCLRET